MVEEDEFRSTYHAVNERRCAFEKAILSSHCACQYAARFYLADREGVSCTSANAQQCCLKLLALLRDNAKFTLKLTSIEGKLPHTKEIKVQQGGLSGLYKTLYPKPAEDNNMNNIAGLISDGIKAYGSLEAFPFQEIMQTIASHEGRKRKPRPNRH